jgi:2-dehydro-3-deoxyphosphooctonate aldolase (KDO 8-P synthase)
MKIVKINDKISVGNQQALLLIAGPCQIESEEHALFMADKLMAIVKNLPFNLIYKSSFDKANRTSLTGQRGLGIEKGLEILAKVKKETGLPVLTDIHTEEQATQAAEVVDILQIPAFLCRQTDLLIAAGKTQKTINVKKGQFLHPADMQFCVDKILSTGNEKILLCERGTCHGYRDLVVDMRSFMIMRETGFPVVFDATHSVQQMGSAGGSSGGSREFIPGLARAASAFGIDSLFIECHENPDRAPSDSKSMLNLNDLPKLLSDVHQIRKIINQA